MLLMPRFQKIAVLACMVLAPLLCLPNFLPASNGFGRIILGLDLQGGAHLVYEADIATYKNERLNIVKRDLRQVLRPRDVVGTADAKTPALPPIAYRDLTQTPSNIRFSVVREADADEALNRLQQHFASGNLTTAELRVTRDKTQILIDFNPATEAQRIASITDRALEVLRRRVDAFGTREPSIMRQGNDRIVVQVPGENDVNRLKNDIGRTARLSFHTVDLAASAQQNSATPPAVPAGRKALRDNERQSVVVVDEIPLLTGQNLLDASSALDNQGQAAVSFRLDSTGSRLFAEITQNNIGKPFAIVLDNKLLSAPVIQSAITGGSGIISGHFTTQTAADLSLLLRAGALPVPLKVVEERTVGPELGHDSVVAGAKAFMGALVVVSLFMVVYYGRTGVYAAIALLVNTLGVLGLLSLLQATLTLPGIAGLVLGMGMAVDANVLINERIREELRHGLTPFKAADVGYARAWDTVLDSHMTGLASALLMFVLGAGPIKGFAVTLSLGIAMSLFSAVWVTRLFMASYLLRARPTHLRFGLFDRA